MAGRPSQRRELAVWMNDQRVGRWSVTPGSGHGFSYDPAWLRSPQVRPLSLSMPLSAGTRAFKGAVVESYFDNLLPGHPALRLRLQGWCGAVSTAAFDLLSALGRDCAGAVSLLEPQAAIDDVQTLQGDALDDAALARLLDRCTDAAGVSGQADADHELLRVVLAGEQPKTALLWHGGRWCRPRGATPTTHILKLPLGAQPGGTPGLNTSLENEWLCGRLLGAFGFDVAASQLTQIGAHKVLVVERFDRRLVDGRWWARLPMEDFFQATATPAPRPGGSTAGPDIARMLDLLRGADDAARDRERLLMALVVLWMLAATDRTAKGFSLLLKPLGRYGLAPLYDVMSAWPILGRAPSPASLHRLCFALAPGGAGAPDRYDSITRQHWLDAARRCAVGGEIARVVDGLARWTDQAIERTAAELPEGFPRSVSGPVFDGLKRSARLLTP